MENLLTSTCSKTPILATAASSATAPGACKPGRSFPQRSSKHAPRGLVFRENERNVCLKHYSRWSERAGTLFFNHCLLALFARAT